MIKWIGQISKLMNYGTKSCLQIDLIDFQQTSRQTKTRRWGADKI